MSSLVEMKLVSNVLQLNGVLDAHSVPFIWDNTLNFKNNFAKIDTSSLSRVDSSGLAFLVYLCIKHNAKLISISEQLRTLIDLYDLEKIAL